MATAERGLMGRREALPGLSLKVTKPGVGGDTASQSQAKLTLAYFIYRKIASGAERMETRTCQILLGLCLAPQVKDKLTRSRGRCYHMKLNATRLLSVTGALSKPFPSSSLAPFPGGGGLGTAGRGAAAAHRRPSFTTVSRRLSALGPRAKELFIASKPPAEQTQRMELRNKGDRLKGQNHKEPGKVSSVFIFF